MLISMTSASDEFRALSSAKNLADNIAVTIGSETRVSSEPAMVHCVMYR